MAHPTFPLVDVAGSAYDMGRQHGEQASDLIRRYLRLIERLTEKPREVLCAHALQFLPRMEALSPLFVEEIRGLADGAGLSFGEAVLCQVRAEAAHTPEGGCTAFALTGEATADGQPLAGQNQDLEPEYSDVSIVLRIRPNDGRPRAVMYTFAGQLGYFGMNAYGVANYANSLYDFKWRPDLPHYPLKRAMLEQRSVAACIELLRTHWTCSAANTILCDGEGHIGDVESRPEGIAVFEGQHPHARIHTNHYLTPEFACFETGSLPDSFARLDRMVSLIQAAWGTITADTLKEMLSDHEGDPAGICRHGARGYHTTSGHIAEPAKGLLHIRRGHGCLGSWTTYEV